MFRTNDFSKQQSHVSVPDKQQAEQVSHSSSSCGGCRSCHETTRAFPQKKTLDGAGDGNAQGPDLSKPCASKFFQRNVGNSRMQQAAAPAQAKAAPMIQKCDCSHSSSQEKKEEHGVQAKLISDSVNTTTHTPAVQKCGCNSEKKEEHGVQAKMTIGSAGDSFEHEADIVADKVMRMPITDAFACVNHAPLAQNIQRIPQGQTPTMETTDNFSVSQQGGHELSYSTRQYMEPRFGVNFGSVRIHNDAESHDKASQINARAFTYGNHIWLGNGEQESNNHLMAHELTHVVQQTSPPVQSGNGMGAGANSHTHGPMVQMLGANPGCTKAQADTIHQAIYNATGWLNNAIPKMEASPPGANVITALRRNFGPTYGVQANLTMIKDRIVHVKGQVATIPYSCSAAGDATCAADPCGYTPVPGCHSAVICTNVSLTPGTDWVYQAGCVLHEAFHASYTNFTVDHYSGWNGHSGASADYPGAGTDPLLNADSYTTMVMDLS